MFILLRALCLLVSLVSFGAYSAPLKVAVSIKPLHGLVMELGGNKIATPTLLIQEGLSPHDAALRPSEVKALNYADLIIWVGPAFETCLTPYMTDPTKHLTLVNTDLPLLELASSDFHHHDHEGHDHNHSHHSHEGHDEVATKSLTPAEKARQSRMEHIHSHEGPVDMTTAGLRTDPHLWLDPDLMKDVAALITKALIEKAPEHKAYFLQMLAKVQRTLDDLDTDLKANFKGLSNQPFMVFHDSYRYLAKRYNLNLEGSLNLNPHLPLSGKKIAEMKKLIQKEKIQCLFTDTETHQNTTLFNEFGVKTPMLDPLGDKSLPKGLAGYRVMMLNLSTTMRNCLAPQAQVNAK